MSNNYYLDRNRNNMRKLNEMLADLPAFCSVFFIGIQDTTTPLTRLNYAVDLKLFFNYLVTYEAAFYGKEIKSITMSDIDGIDAQTIERFLAYLSYYDKDNGEVFTNSERGKLRKLSTLRAFLKYFFNKDMIKANVASKVKSPKLHEKPIIRLEPQETAELLYSCETLNGFSEHQKKYNEKFKVRDNAIISLLQGLSYSLYIIKLKILFNVIIRFLFHATSIACLIPLSTFATLVSNFFATSAYKDLVIQINILGCSIANLTASFMYAEPTMLGGIPILIIISDIVSSKDLFSAVIIPPLHNSLVICPFKKKMKSIRGARRRLLFNG